VIIHLVQMTHASIEEKERISLGVTENLIRDLSYKTLSCSYLHLDLNKLVRSKIILIEGPAL
jgi:O-acetylhomoserine/O-acetylserine sulfhydrylase-like pyridoxal-dependent enzyme